MRKRGFHNLKRTAGTAMALIFAFSLMSVPGCKREENEVPAAVEETWYTAEKNEFAYAVYGTPNTTDLYIGATSDGENIVLSGSMTKDPYLMAVNHFDIITMSVETGAVEMTIGYEDLKGMMQDNNMAIYGDYFDTVATPFSINGSDYLQLYNPSDYEAGYMDTKFYVRTDEGGYDGPVEIAGLGVSDATIVTGSFRIGGGTAVTLSDSTGFIYEEDTEINTDLVLGDGEGGLVYIDLDELLGESPLVVNDISEIRENTILVSYQVSLMAEPKRKAVDISNAEAPVVEEDSVIPECISQMNDIYTIPDGTICMSNDEALYYLGDDGEPVKAVDYALAGYNMAAFRFMRLIDRREDGSLLFLSNDATDSEDAFSLYYSSSWSTLELTPREPDTRQQLRIGVTDLVNYKVGQTVVDFNNTNDTYFARIELMCLDDNEYVYDIPYTEFPDDDYDNYLDILVNNTFILTEKLRSDPPDVFISGDVLMTSPDTGLFVDLNSYIDSENGLDRDEYYDNIFRLSETDGLLCHIPMVFYLTGLMGESPDGIPQYGGFTYQEYIDTTEEYGGWDPLHIYCNPDTYAEELMSVQYDLFVDRVQGTANFHNAAFYALLDYLSQMGTYESQFGRDVTVVIIDPEMTMNLELLDYGNIYIPTSNLMLIGYMNDNASWYGLPSYDGRGIAAGALVTEAIPVNAAYPEGAWDFIKFSLSEEAQSVINSMPGIPVNRAAVANCLELTDGEFDLEETIEHADCFYVTDIELRYICHQAIGAYLRGECSADDAADIIENFMLEIMGSSGRQEENE